MGSGVLIVYNGDRTCTVAEKRISSSASVIVVVTTEYFSILRQSDYTVLKWIFMTSKSAVGAAAVQR